MPDWFWIGLLCLLVLAITAVSLRAGRNYDGE